MKRSRLVTIAVTTRNSGQTLEACLESIHLQDYPLIELVVVDNFSSDDTLEIARRYTKNVLLGGPERAAQRNLALGVVAQGEIYGYVDSDMILGPKVVSTAVETLDCGAAGVFVQERILAKGVFGRVRRFERNAYTATEVDAIRFFWAEVFENVGGFDEQLPPGPEDWDLSGSVGRLGRLLTVPSTLDDASTEKWGLRYECQRKGFTPDSSSAIYHDESQASFWSTLTKKMYYDDGLAVYKLKWGRGSEAVRKQLSPIYRLFGVFFERQNRATTLRNLHLYALFLFWKSLLVLSLLRRRLSRTHHAL